jgi:hypothetical protein
MLILFSPDDITPPMPRRFHFARVPFSLFHYFHAEFSLFSFFDAAADYYAAAAFDFLSLLMLTFRHAAISAMPPLFCHIYAIAFACRLFLRHAVIIISADALLFFMIFF